jgi:predicted nucleotide-binding protein
MVRSTPVTPPKNAQLSVAELENGITRLRKRLEEVKAFDHTRVVEQFGSPTLERLRASIQDGLARTYGPDTVEYKRYSGAASFSTGPIVMGHRTPPHEVQAALADSKGRSIALLEQALESLGEQLAEARASNPSEGEPEATQTYARSIFIVHGHDEGARETVARFLEKVGFEAIILHERANRGRTVIEKVEANGDVGFAVVLLTADDEGNARGEPPKSRVRQNVLLELGYFLGRLGRSRVCALKKGDPDIPSDFAGVVWEPLDDAGGWRTALARELQAAGYEIDWNKVMRG